MNRGLEILIARTKTHPEEFTASISLIQSRWLTMIDDFEYYMTEEEKEAWQEAKEGLNKYKRTKKRDDFTEEVMKELLIRDGCEEVRDDGVALNSVSRPKKLITAASITNEALAILAGGGGGGGNYPSLGGGYGGGGSSYAGSGGSVVVKTPTGTHTFTKNGVVTVKGDEQVTWLPNP